MNTFSYRACPQWEENLGFTSDFHLNADTLISYHDEQSAPLPEIAKVERGGEGEGEGERGRDIERERERDARFSQQPFLALHSFGQHF